MGLAGDMPHILRMRTTTILLQSHDRVPFGVIHFDVYVCSSVKLHLHKLHRVVS
jgi:hypothetical protein